MLGEITKQLYIYTVTAPPDVLEYLENDVTRSFVNGLLYRARRRGRERLTFRDNLYDVVYDSQFHYRITRVTE